MYCIYNIHVVHVHVYNVKTISTNTSTHKVCTCIYMYSTCTYSCMYTLLDLAQHFVQRQRELEPQEEFDAREDSKAPQGKGQVVVERDELSFACLHTAQNLRPGRHTHTRTQSQTHGDTESPKWRQVHRVQPMEAGTCPSYIVRVKPMYILYIHVRICIYITYTYNSTLYMYIGSKVLYDTHK